MGTSEWAIDVRSSDFGEKVVEASQTRPVLVDFWASWCGPCRILGPILEKLATEYEGAFVLAKVDTEANQELAGQFGIRGIPAVKLFRNGVVEDEFVGALPESAIREFLDKHVESALDKALAQVRAHREQGELSSAEALLEPIMLEHGTSPVALLEATRLSLASGKPQEARTHAAAIPITAKEYDQAKALGELAELAEVCHAAGNPAAVEEATEQDLAAQFARGACLAVGGEYRKALDQFLAIVGRDRKFRDDGARRAMLTVFAVAGDDALAREYRRKLTILL